MDWRQDMEPDKSLEKQALREWRAKNWHEIMDANKKVLECIRDGEHGNKKVECKVCGEEFEVPWASASDIVKATQTLARMVSGLQPERVTSGTSKSKALQPVALGLEKVSDAELEEIERLADGGEIWEDEKEES